MQTASRSFQDRSSKKKKKWENKSNEKHEARSSRNVVGKCGYQRETFQVIHLVKKNPTNNT